MSDLAPDLVFLHRLTTDNGYRHARPIGGGLYACIARMGFTHAIIVGDIGDHDGHRDRWCYHTMHDALQALEAWQARDCRGEPEGWHRHPGSGRRLAENERSYDDDDKLVPIGTIYVRR